MKRIKSTYHRLAAIIALQLLLFLGAVIDPSLIFQPYIIGFYALICAFAVISIVVMGNSIEQVEEQMQIANRHELLRSAISAYFAVYNKKTRIEFEQRGIVKIIALGKPSKGNSNSYQWKFFDSSTQYQNFMAESFDDSFNTTIIVFDPNEAIRYPGFISLN